MKRLMAVFSFSMFLSIPPTIAHEGHEHSFVTETVAIEIGRDYSVRFTQKDGGYGFGKLPESWSNVPAKNAKLHKNGDGYYIVSVTNDAEQKTLYVLMTSNGDVNNANFNGEFKELTE